MLYKKYKTYKNAIDNCKYAFAADVWRCFKAAKTRTNYFYMDANTLIDPIRFKTFLDSLLKYKYFFIFEASTIVWNGVFYCNNKHDRIFKYCLLLYKYKLKNCVPNGPYVLTYAIFNKISKKDFLKHSLIKDTRFVDFREDNFIKNNSGGSWTENHDVKQGWINSFESFKANPLVLNENKYHSLVHNNITLKKLYFKAVWLNIGWYFIPKHIKKLLKKVLNIK